MTKRIFRSRTEKIFGGVSGGIGNYFNIDPVLVRLLWVVAFVLGGWSLLVYIGAWIIIPKEPMKTWEPKEEVKEEVKENTTESSEESK